MSHTSAHQIYKIFGWQLKINGKVRCNKLAQKYYYTMKGYKYLAIGYNHIFKYSWQKCELKQTRSTSSQNFPNLWELRGFLETYYQER